MQANSHPFRTNRHSRRDYRPDNKATSLTIFRQAARLAAEDREDRAKWLLGGDGEKVRGGDWQVLQLGIEMAN